MPTTQDLQRAYQAGVRDGREAGQKRTQQLELAMRQIRTALNTTSAVQTITRIVKDALT